MTKPTVVRIKFALEGLDLYRSKHLRELKPTELQDSFLQRLCGKLCYCLRCNTAQVDEPFGGKHMHYLTPFIL